MILPFDYALYEAAASGRHRWVRQFESEADAFVRLEDERVTTRQANGHPALLSINAASGVHIEGMDGRRYLDLHGNNCHTIGYTHPRIVAALTEQLGRFACNTRGFTNREFTQFATLLRHLWPGSDGRVFLVPGGSAAIELALAVARVHTGKCKSITFDDSYHGRSFGAVSLSGGSIYRSPRLGPLLPSALYVPSYRVTYKSGDDPEEKAWESLGRVQSLLEADRDVACLIAEPMAGDIRRPPDWYWPEIRQLCSVHDVLLIFDEIPTGLGKQGAMFGSELFDVCPDITVLGKALGGATVPAAAVVVDGRFDSAPELDLGYFTHEKNPLMARAAYETLSIILDERLIENSRDLGAEALSAVQDVADRHACLISGPVRGQGLMISFDIGQQTSDPIVDETLAHSIFLRCIEEGMILNYPARGTRMTLSFPLIATVGDVHNACHILDRVFAVFSGGC